MEKQRDKAAQRLQRKHVRLVDSPIEDFPGETDEFGMPIDETADTAESGTAE